ncbi:MAG: spore cortex biosynthesis protein YabQ [Clostridia bacterium]|nr:spore cortex biosynthesis protein YabQ [Clostridia bacterium]
MNDVSIASQTLTLGQAIIAGIVMGIYYDIFRILRRIFRFKYATIVAQDVFFWITSAIAVFFVTIWFSGGVVRIYFVVAVLCGWLLYAFTLGALAMYIVDLLIRVIKAAAAFISEKILTPLGKRIISGKGYAKIRRIFGKNIEKKQNIACIDE